MKATFFSVFISLSWAVLAAGSEKLEIPGFSIVAQSDPARDEAWMAFTKPVEVSRYALTNAAIKLPLIVTILRYTNSESAKKAFQLSWGSRPHAPEKLGVAHWDAAHRWRTNYRGQTDMCLLKGNFVVGVYHLPSDFSNKSTDNLLEALAGSLAKAKRDDAAKGNPPVCLETNRTSSAAGSHR